MQGAIIMKKHLLGSLAFLALHIGSSALAADIGAEPFVGRMPPPVAYNWTGFYLGGNAGGHWSKDDVTTSSFGGVDALSSTSLGPSGFIAGVQTGYNWQVGNVVLGIELDGNWLGGTASRTFSNFGAPFNPADAIIQNAKAEFLTTVRPRAGVAFDRVFLYVTGGLAFGTIKTTDTFSSSNGTVFAATNSSTRTGETIGGGLEYAFLDNWTAKIEYLYVSFGSFDTLIPRTAGPITVHHKYSDNVARVGLNYRFFGPVYWKY